MVIKGGARAGAAELSAHLQRIDTNERAELQELRGVAALDLDGALFEMEAVATGARSKRHFYHASINTRRDEVMTPEQWTRAVDRLEQELDLTGQPRAVVMHVKGGRAHTHVVWSRIDLDSMTAIPDSHNYRRHEIVAREMEREFGHAHVQGVHVERDGQPRPERTPSHAEMQQADRSRITPDQATALLTEIWNQTDSGKAFASAIDEHGWVLAHGDRRDFVVVDPNRGVHSLARRIDGLRVKDVRARMVDLDTRELPTVAEAKLLLETKVLSPVLAPEVEPAKNADDTIAPPRQSMPGQGSLTNTVSEPDELPKTSEKPTVATADARMVAQQQEAQRRFERNSADFERRLHAQRGALDAKGGSPRETDGPVLSESEAGKENGTPITPAGTNNVPGPSGRPRTNGGGRSR